MCDSHSQESVSLFVFLSPLKDGWPFNLELVEIFTMLPWHKRPIIILHTGQLSRPLISAGLCLTFAVALASLGSIGTQWRASWKTDHGEICDYNRLNESPFRRRKKKQKRNLVLCICIFLYIIVLKSIFIRWIPLLCFFFLFSVDDSVFHNFSLVEQHLNHTVGLVY